MARVIPGILAVGLAALSVAGAKGSVAGGQDMEKQCAQAWLVSRGDSPWQGYTSDYKEEEAGKHISAVALDPSFEVPKHLTRYAADGKPLLAIDRKGRRVHLEAAFFSDLERPDATRLAKGKRLVFGTLKQLPKGLTHADLARFLVESQLIQTYWHLEARLCPGAVTDDAAQYRVELRGVHSYCTNRCQEDPLAFAVRIDKKSGELSVEGI
jgi:hypothetical protein